MRSPPIKVLVGEDLEDGGSEFFIPKETFVKHSDFAAAALKNGWQESHQQIIKLPTQDPKLFEIFAAFVSTGKIHSSEEGDIYQDTNNSDRPSDKEWSRLSESWILGDVLQSSSFRDAVADAIIQKSIEQNKWPTGVQYRVYPHSIGSNGIRRLVVDIAAFRWSGEECQTRDADAVEMAHFFGDACVRLADKQRGAKDPFDSPGCRYHDHGEEKPCYKTMF